MALPYEKLVEEQRSIGEGLVEVLKQLPMLKTTRQVVPTLMKRLGSVDKEWLTFLNNDLQLKQDQDFPINHEYFKETYFETISVLVSQITAGINLTIQNITSVNPEYDLVNRGNRANMRMFDDMGRDLRDVPKSDEERKNDQQGQQSGNDTNAGGSGTSPTDNTTIVTENLGKPNGNANQSGGQQKNTASNSIGSIMATHSTTASNGGTTGSVKIGTLEPPIQEFFDNVSNYSLNRSGNNDDHVPIHGMKKATKILEDALTKFAREDHREMDESKIRIKASAVIDKWDTVKKLHEGLMARDLDRYDASIFYECENKVRETLEQLRENIKPDDTPSNDRNATSKREKSIKMPQIEIPKFDGDYGKWAVFKDLFKQMVDQRELSGSEKFMYLRTNLSGEPHDMIKALQVTSENYKLAWALLNERYENPRHIIKSMLTKLLFNQERAKANNSASLKKMYDSFREVVYAAKIAAKTDEKLLDMILHQLLLHRMDTVSLGLYEQTVDNEKQPTTMEELLKFIAKRFRALEYSIDDNTNKQVHQMVPNKNFMHKMKAVAFTAVADKKVKLCTCKEQHSITKCPKFTKLSIDERYKLAKRASVCLKCLKPGHSYKQCTGKPCFTCNKNHHTLLHFVKQEASAHLGSTIRNPGFDHVFLGTAIIYVMNANGAPIQMRALLDSGAQLNIMSEKMLQKTGLKCTPTNMQIAGLGEVLASSNKRTTINLASVHSNYETALEVFIMKTVTTCQPLKEVDVSNWNIPKRVELADPAFNLPAKIDILIGAELFYRMMVNGLIKLGNGLPDLQNTVFGWIVIGRVLGLQSNNAFAGMAITNTDNTLQHQLEQFWKVEEKGTNERGNLTDEELKCELTYDSTTVRQKDGRFVVQLQFIKDPVLLGSSKDMAIRRFMALERRFVRDPQLKKEYCTFMQEYLDLGHMQRVPAPSVNEPHYMIPHHSVLNPASSTTKFRVVFDASAKTTSNVSLNDLMSNGPMLQQDLFSIMARFRIWRYVFSADFSRMYRQIQIANDERCWQMIVWRNDHSKELEYYKLNTVTYGTKCASYLAIRSLRALADIEADNFPLAAVVAKRDFNVDDVMTGSNDLLDAINCQSQLTEMMKLGKFDLHKWCSNHPALLDSIPEKKRAVSLDINADVTETKALGMKWIPHSDTFSIKYEPKEHQKITKRTILSETAQLFDPLGLVSPVIVKAKIFLQELWKNEMDWDVVLDEAGQQKWIAYRDQLPEVNDISLPRHVVIEDAVNVQIHIFSDASEIAYGAAAYIRSVSSTGVVKVQLLCSKSRVAPTGKSKLTLPRLELCGATVASDLAKKVKSIIEIEVHDIKYWTDSEILLSWLYNDTTLKTFVANRVNHVKRNTKVEDWKHVESKQNPADTVSRGASVAELKADKQWWNGPEFLWKPESEWPQSKPAFLREPEEEKIVKSILMATTVEKSIVAGINHGNSLSRWQRILAYCLKFLQPKGTDQNAIGLLPTELLKKALTAIIKYAQSTGLKDDLKWIKQKQPEKSKFKTMTPIIDADGVLRVGGRLQEANMPFEQQHPAILPYRHEVTKLVMQKAHIDNMHAGPQALLGLVRQ